MPTVIIITAAVHPSPEFSVAISNPEERLRQYNAALASWRNAANATNSRLVVLETSGNYRLARDARSLDAAEIFTFTPGRQLVQRGKGAVEAAAIDQFLCESAIDDQDVVVKATGRLAVMNAASLITDMHPSVFRGRRTIDRSFCDTRFFVTTAAVWRSTFSGSATEVDDPCGRYLEHVLAHRIVEAEYASVITFERFRRRPAIVGTSGSTGANYRRRAALAPMLSVVETALYRRLSKKQV